LRYVDAVPESDEGSNVLGRVSQLRSGVVAGVLGVALPEVLKDAVEGFNGEDFLARPVRDVVAGIGGLSDIFGTDVSKTVGELTSSVKTLWDMAGGPATLAAFTTAVGSLAQSDPLSALSGLVRSKTSSK
jgi:hypothetical protein